MKMTDSQLVAALEAYHRKAVEEAGILTEKPVHDWASHGADAFGLMCVHYEAPKVGVKKPKVVLRKIL